MREQKSSQKYHGRNETFVERLEDNIEEISHNVKYNFEGFKYQRGRIRMLEDQSKQKIYYPANWIFREMKESNERKPSNN